MSPASKQASRTRSYALAAIHIVLSKRSFAQHTGDDGVAGRHLHTRAGFRNSFNKKEAEIESNLLSIALRDLTAEVPRASHPIGTAVAVVPTFHGPDDPHVAIDAIERETLRPQLPPGDKPGLWRLSQSTVTCSEAE